MERMPEQPPKPKAPPPVDVERKAREYVQSLVDRPKPVPVDYMKQRPVAKPEQSSEEVADKKLRELAFHMAKLKEEGETRTAFQIYQDLKRQANEKKMN